MEIMQSGSLTAGGLENIFKADNYIHFYSFLNNMYKIQKLDSTHICVLNIKLEL